MQNLRGDEGNDLGRNKGNGEGDYGDGLLGSNPGGDLGGSLPDLGEDETEENDGNSERTDGVGDEGNGGGDNDGDDRGNHPPDDSRLVPSAVPLTEKKNRQNLLSY